MVVDGGWKPQQSLDRASRQAKAAKIIRLVESRRALADVRLLEIGTGAGIITSLLAEHVGEDGEVWSVDVDDLRTVTAGYSFKQVDSAALPFGDDEFDVVVSNHTIEHVGGYDDQLLHVKEMGRVLKSDGVAYLASPSRWALVEPHFKVPFLSWLPASARTTALRASRRGKVYDIDPRTRPELRELIREAGLQAHEVTLPAVGITADLERGRLSRLAARVPDPLLAKMRFAIPTMVFLLEH